MENNSADSVDRSIKTRFENVTSKDGRDNPPNKKRCNSQESPIENESPDYFMKRGYAIIFYFELGFGKSIEPKRPEQDSKLLKDTYYKLGFNVEAYKDCTKKEMTKILQKVADVDHQYNDCIAITVLSHSKAGRLEARDGSYAVDELWKPFLKTKSLCGKPKLFFIQAYSDEIQKDSSVTDESMVNYVEFPTVADLLVISCEEYIGSLRLGKGSYFIQSLCKEFDEYGTKFEFLRLLTRVNRRVVSRFQSIESDNGKYVVKQMPSIVSTLTKNLYFTYSVRNRD